MSVTPAPAAPEQRPHPAEQRPVAQIPPHVVVHLATTRWGRWTRWIAWTGFLICGALLLAQSMALRDYFDTTGGIQERYHSGSKYSPSKIAIIRISGIILDGEGYVHHQIERVRNDPSVKGIVVRVDSPGGTVTGSDYIYHHLKELRNERNLPLVVSMGSIATSGGYYVSMAVGDQKQAIYAEPTTTTGSIGVMIPHYDLSGLLDSLKIKDDSLATHPRKLILSMTRPMTDDDRQILERYIGESFQRFVGIVQAGRPALRNSDHKLEFQGQDLATGEMFSAEQAKKNGLVDEIGFIEDAVERCAELAGLSDDEVRVVEYQRLATLADALTGSFAASRSAESTFFELLEGSVPRAFYLCTTLPPLVTTAHADAQ